MHFSLLFLQFAILLFAQSNAEFLRVSGKDFMYGSDKVFLSGVNIAWNRYGYDFGNGNYAESGPILEQWIRDISASGGNTLRIWLHVEGESTPHFNPDGFTLGPDEQGNLVRDLSRFLDVAQENNVFVIIALWNGALMRNDQYKNLLWDGSKLNSYINSALIPMVQGLKDKPALASWEIMKEPEGSILIEANSNPCYDTVTLGQQGAGWSGAFIPMNLMLRFINRQAGAIRRADPKALITIGSWSEFPQTDAFADTFNFYKDSCLTGAGGDADGTVDFFQIHSYSWEGRWSSHGPFKIKADDYNLDKPLIIGEFSKVCSEGEQVEELWGWGYDQGYDGVWSWQYNLDNGHCQDSQADQNRGMASLRNKSGNGRIDVIIH